MRHPARAVVGGKADAGDDAPVRRLSLIAGLLVLLFGLGCLNYTADGKADHHREWAREKGMPEPSEWIFVLGLIGTSAGAGAAGFAVGRGRRA